MVKKKISGQTIAIIILTLSLLLTIGFGGVFAFYTARSNKVSGGIIMGNLKISLSGGSGESGKSEIVISNKTNIVPTQSLGNTPLVVQNLSSVSIYLILVYRFDAMKEDENGQNTIVDDSHTTAVFDLDVEYINSINPEHNYKQGVRNSDWVDYVFRARDDDPQARRVYVESEQKYCGAYRCLVSMVTFPKGEDVTVIAQDQLSLAGAMGNEYQNASISFTFQAYAIGAETDFGFEAEETIPGKCEKIVSTMYAGQGHKFLDI